jgi:SAM-dependent methyltransferase
VLAVGNGLPHKNLAAAAAGFVRSWVRDGGDLGLVIVGNVSDEQAVDITSIAVGLGLEPHRVVIHRRVPDEDFAQLLSSAEAVVVPSFHEGFSLPVVEATQLGTPVVLSDIPVHRELLGCDVWSFDPSDPTTLSRALSAVLADPADALARQRSRLRGTYDADRLRRSVHHVVRELCAPLQMTPTRLRPGTGVESASWSRSEGDSLSLSKICELEDFCDPRLQRSMRDVFAHEVARFGEEFPRGREYRKYWEVAMAVMAFEAGGLLDGTRHFLGVGAGNEPTIFHLTRHAASVLATDLYLNEGWEESANASMLTDPSHHWPMPWAPERLQVRHMNALSLDLEDESFAGVFSSSSIEHFGDRGDVQRAMDEAFRVLEPGGILSVSSEFRLKGDRPGLPGTLLFDVDDVYDLFVGNRDWALLEPFDGSISEATMATAMSFMDVAADQQVQVARLGGLWTHHVAYERYPHLVLRHRACTFTSFHLALRKAA